MTVKRELARTICGMYHSPAQALDAEAVFNRIFSQKDIPDDITTIVIGNDTLALLVKLLTDHGLVSSNGEGRRLISQGAVRVNDEKVSDIAFQLDRGKEYIIKVGKRRFVKFICEN